MGRIKRGLDYFPLSTNFVNERITRRLMKREGDVALGVLLAAWSCLYGSESAYYLRVDEELYNELADLFFELDSARVAAIIASSVELGMFDARLFRERRILTSADIQRQYLFSSRRRTGRLIDPAYCLLDEEELASYRHPVKSAAVAPAEGESVAGGGVATQPDDVASGVENATISAENATFTPPNNKTDQNRTDQTTTKHTAACRLPDPPEVGEEGGTLQKKRAKDLTQDDIDRMAAPDDGVPRNFSGLLDNLRLYKVPPSEQYALILKSNYGAIGGEIWKALSVLRGSGGKIRLPGHFLLSAVRR